MSACMTVCMHLCVCVYLFVCISNMDDNFGSCFLHENMIYLLSKFSSELFTHLLFLFFILKYLIQK